MRSVNALGRVPDSIVPTEPQSQKGLLAYGAAATTPIGLVGACVGFGRSRSRAPRYRQRAGAGPNGARPIVESSTLLISGDETAALLVLRRISHTGKPHAVADRSAGAGAFVLKGLARPNQRLSRIRTRDT